MSIRKEKKSFFRFMTNIIGLIFVIIVGLAIYMSYEAKYKNINLNQLNTKLYIQAADDASKGKLQVNWKYMAAIDGVRYKNDFSNISDQSLNELANMFLEKNSTSSKIKNSEYELVDLDVVLGKLSLDEKQKKKVYNYIDDLKYTGSKKNNLKDNSKEQFIQQLYPQAAEIYDKYGVLPSVIISQAILESGWGKSDLSIQANNLFGIKADSSWKGKKIKMNTSEYYNQKIKDDFRVYNSEEESMKDYGEFLKNNKRYKQSGVFDATEYLDQAKAIEKAGYSTVQNDKGEEIYSKLLIDIIQEQNLQLLDYECEMNYKKTS
ncbi:glycoside hydrolase family 73 protein [Clostridium saccharobutylicum]|uniref:Mannosyl-glycoprotein endo-beta-N-acetylglucosamidase n=1 Tax=Clostridium saccharobutylicum DSM 13864 TaxID=1345695 RepID=U5MTQ7_CLOSA|nr:glucosaminidase domain-containing protein [Clostridium saccharobutylicum]AGX44179.1 mannosyl-glycoprotein endo-beta-N-acetylglucosamidase [Clostridium saccharobutylicum DSM 13864]AQR91467.1 Exo-glucosaminidase LytG precursor [Clostridium saccharobutylicum]AQS01371.1 Exo-glucosaminidase LytG precursor [Clostridium saccharobutylicum]AQS10979.1 Exo-glucosaminidase LytG precursor [Clostridium saccharobutylicum]AQS15354.1 Exo-glucosaminidase LytG precursor [Clostridium saccharobutylicum]